MTNAEYYIKRTQYIGESHIHCILQGTSGYSDNLLWHHWWRPLLCR